MRFGPLDAAEQSPGRKKNDTNNDGVILVARKFFVYDVDDKIIELGVKVPHSVRKAGLPDL